MPRQKEMKGLASYQMRSSLNFNKGTYIADDTEKRLGGNTAKGKVWTIQGFKVKKGAASGRGNAIAGSERK